MPCYKASRAAKNGAFHSQPINRVDAIQDKKLQTSMGCGFKAATERGNISIETASNILNIIYQCVQSLELSRPGSRDLSIQTKDWQPGRDIDAIINFSVCF